MENREHKISFRLYVLRIGIVMVVVATFLLIMSFVFEGKTTVTGEYPAATRTDSVVCTKSNATYSYVDAPDSEETPTQGELRIVGTFSESKIMQKISLDFSVSFPNHEAAVLGEAVMHGELGKRLGSEELLYSELGNNFSIIDKKVTLSLIADMDEITEKNYKYLLLSSNPNSLKTKLTSTEFERNYQNLGLKCVSTNK